ncbi:pickpocket protein 19-like [Musca domestica]|uniref:Pickpocket protein 19-like n=1 Tax=Musca domestica TaxID=7370 RepID=A0A1I8N253_MUSDO|nr:pickpocket protein 19-like [Musca domestica]
MFYPNELAYFKKTNFEHPKGLLKFKDCYDDPLQPLTKRQVEKRIIRRMFQFCQNSINGVYHISEPGLRPSVRLFWCVVVVAAIIGCAMSYIDLTKRLQDEALVTVVETSHLPIHEIRFPAVAVCPLNRVNWMRYKAAEEKFLPRYTAKEAKNAFYNLTVLLERMTFSGLEAIEDFLNSQHIPRSVRNIVLSRVAQYLAFRCDEIFRWCIYDKTKHDCCKIFIPEQTEKGICLVFNSVVSKESKIKQLTDSFYPWRARSSGEGSGLSFRLRYNSSLVRPGSTVPFAFNVIIKRPGEWSNSLYQILHANTHNNMMVTPIITETSRNTRHINPVKRKCLFPNEISTKFDRIEGLAFNKLNCRVQCEQRHLINTCNCTTSMFFPGVSHKADMECKVSDLRCIYDNRDIFSYIKGSRQDNYINDTRRGMICDCLNSCEALMFLVKLNVLPLVNVNESFPEISAEVYFAEETMTKYSARLQYTYMDLISNYGGVLGLCLGASVLSIFEIFYAVIRAIFIFGLYKLTNRRKRRQVNVVKVKKKEDEGQFVE